MNDILTADTMVYLGSFAASGLLALVAWWRINRSVAAENTVVFEEWERH